MKTCSLLLTLFLGTSAQALEGLNSLESQLNEKNQSLLALKNDVAAKEQVLKSSYANFYPTLEAVGGWGEDRMAAPGDRQGVQHRRLRQRQPQGRRVHEREREEQPGRGAQHHFAEPLVADSGAVRAGRAGDQPHLVALRQVKAPVTPRMTPAPRP